MKKRSLRTVILFGLCALIWTVRVVFDIVTGGYQNSVTIFVLNVICAVVWSVCFAVGLKNCLAKKDED